MNSSCIISLMRTWCSSGRNLLEYNLTTKKRSSTSFTIPALCSYHNSQMSVLCVPRNSSWMGGQILMENLIGNMKFMISSKSQVDLGVGEEGSTLEFVFIKAKECQSCQLCHLLLSIHNPIQTLASGRTIFFPANDKCHAHLLVFRLPNKFIILV